MKKTELLFVLLMGLVSCEKDKLVIIENKHIPLISRELSYGAIRCVYVYNEANLVIAKKTRFHYTKYNYDEDNNLTSSEFYMDAAMFSSDSRVVEALMLRKEWVNPANTEKSLTIKFEYNIEGYLSKAIYERPGVINSEYSEFSWTDGRMKRKTMFWNQKESGYVDYFYDDRGNLVKETKYYITDDGVTMLTSSTEYEFDNLKNPFVSFKRLITPGIFTNPDNIIKETYTVYPSLPGGAVNPQVTLYSYRYNIEGYPEKVNDDTEYIYR